MAVIACFTHLLNWRIHRECLLVLEPGMSRRKDVKKGWSVWTTGDVGRGEGSLQLVICCSTRDETKGLSLGEQRDRRPVGMLPGFLADDLP